ncbi:uncharacterized protein LOC118391916 [Oncorhynchus keta]|uniref:uncharacterized protein LOC118391916 n=1 Tax=Oncorhynchus keta TaxID=8018 RepID=UPI00227C949C|nr:uncharacterized protein LOC118391916 [Oncorhynchus keta]
MATFEMKSILKVSKLKLESSTQSHSIGAVRWNLPEEDLQAHSSAPTSPSKSCAPSTCRLRQHRRQNGLKNLRSLQECVRFINHWKEQVAEVCQSGSDAREGTSKGETSEELKDPRTERSLEESRKLILLWANELTSVDKELMKSPWVQERSEKVEEEEENRDGEEDPNEEVQQRIMEWAKELQSASESCGVQSDELGKVLRLLGLRKKRLVNLLPLLEFITWSLLKEDCKVSSRHRRTQAHTTKKEGEKEVNIIYWRTSLIVY